MTASILLGQLESPRKATNSGAAIYDQLKLVAVCPWPLSLHCTQLTYVHCDGRLSSTSERCWES
jgi:hypothetical protein